MSIRIAELPKVFFDELQLYIKDNTKQLLLKYILFDSNDPNAAINTYVKNMLESIFVSEENQTVDLLTIKEMYSRRQKSSKRYWYKTLEQEVKSGVFTPIHQEWEVLSSIKSSKYLSEVVRTNDTIEKEEFIINRLSEVKIWANDKTQLLTDFPYLREKKKGQIEVAFINDFVNIICDFIKMAGNRNWISIRPKEMVENPFFSDGRKKMKGVIQDRNKKILYDDYKTSENVIRTFLEVNSNDELQIDRMYTLDEKDSEILDYILQQRDERFLNEKRIVFDLYPIVSAVYGKSKKAYRLVEQRILRFRGLSIEGRSTGAERKTVFGYNLFDSVKVTTEEATGRVFAEVVFSDSLHKLYLQEAIETYTHLIHRLENKLSKIFIYALQKERLDAYVNNREMKEYFEYTFFAERVRFRAKKVETNLLLIEASLEEFLKSDILISSYKRNGTGFEIKLKPLTDSEKEDFRLVRTKHLLNG